MRNRDKASTNHHLRDTTVMSQISFTRETLQQNFPKLKVNNRKNKILDWYKRKVS